MRKHLGTGPCAALRYTSRADVPVGDHNTATMVTAEQISPMCVALFIYAVDRKKELCYSQAETTLHFVMDESRRKADRISKKGALT